ncbi:acyl-CoA dehydratase activase-related protein [Marinisporobacter balticus]|uniref:Putative nucleotide-binding protein (Sugar kinase/HSP70/actin superfamily) n=1 Tax=Marinisporobacter balticus TaxID=2018667 RepID=A0A4R2KUJ4_9FIRM|nr:acyl-CoA dehydratase activase-related protein [Marinisporobacter balticus]TCO76487.1 putative nucleotide-binding protein (sugar kinase/HSP70/actin superfamily) [Marinisporobacter balticus]
MKIGIPRGLLYYYYYPLWRKFFETLGAQVLISKKTNKKIVDNGVKNTVDDACLPIKVYIGHVMDLKNQVDLIFVPKMMSIHKDEYICPKFCGLPEMVRSGIKDLPQMIDTTIDFHKSKKKLSKTVYEMGNYITKDRKKIDFAFEKALKEHESYKVQIKNGMLPIDLEDHKIFKNINLHRRKVKILLLGHPYNIYDAYLSMNIIEKLREHNMDVITQDSFDTKVMNEKAAIMDKKIFWSFGRKVIGAAFYAMEQKDIQGIIYLSSFGCGIDSVIADIIERRTRRNSDKPFILLTIDEHTGEAGINTRIEAFVDMIKWRGKNENNFSTYGKNLSTR